jgi:hypothetical protein
MGDNVILILQKVNVVGERGLGYGERGKVPKPSEVERRCTGGVIFCGPRCSMFTAMKINFSVIYTLN